VLPLCGPERAALAVALAAKYEARASMTELMAFGGCDYGDLMQLLKEAGVEPRGATRGEL